MKKIMCMVLVLLMLLTLPIFAAEDQSETKSQNQQVAEELLEGFYSDAYGQYEIYYNDGTVDQKARFKDETMDWWNNGDYDAILHYTTQEHISVVRNHVTPRRITPGE